MIADALKGIGCPVTEKITRKAIEALGIGGKPSPEKVEDAMEEEDPAIAAALALCDEEYHTSGEDIAARLFAWIKQNRGAIQVGKHVK